MMTMMTMTQRIVGATDTEPEEPALPDGLAETPPPVSVAAMASVPAAMASRNRSSGAGGRSLADDVVRLEIGERAADALAGLDAHPAFAGAMTRSTPLSAPFLPELPGVEGRRRRRRRWSRPPARRDEDDDLVARSLAGSASSFGRALRDLRRTSLPRGVGDVTVEWRRGERPARAATKSESRKRARATTPRDTRPRAKRHVGAIARLRRRPRAPPAAPAAAVK